MKRACLTAATLALAGCQTHTRVHPVVDGDHFILCDSGRDDDPHTSRCTGANPEKGIAKVCLPDGRPIVAIRKSETDRGILVTCGPKPVAARPAPKKARR